MAREIARRLIGGIWRTADVDEDSGGGSGPVGTFAEVKDDVRFAAIQVPAGALTYYCNIGDGSGTTFVYDNGTNDDGVGATLTSAVNAALAIDGITPEIGDRVFLYDNFDQGNYTTGIYTVTDLGADDPAGSPFVLTRATDCDTAAKAGKLWYCTVTDGSYQDANCGTNTVDPSQQFGYNNNFITIFVQLGSSFAQGRDAVVLYSGRVPGTADIVDGFAFGPNAVAESDGVAIGSSARAVASSVGINGTATVQDMVALGPHFKVLSVDVDPDAGAGVAAPVGTLFLRWDNGTFWAKTGATDTDWQQLAFVP